MGGRNYTAGARRGNLTYTATVLPLANHCSTKSPLHYLLTLAHECGPTVNIEFNEHRDLGGLKTTSNMAAVFTTNVCTHTYRYLLNILKQGRLPQTDRASSFVYIFLARVGEVVVDRVKIHHAKCRCFSYSVSACRRSQTFGNAAAPPLNTGGVADPLDRRDGQTDRRKRQINIVRTVSLTSCFGLVLEVCVLAVGFEINSSVHVFCRV